MASRTETIAALRLINTPKIGAKTFYQLVDEYGSASAAVDILIRQGKYQPWSQDKACDEIAAAENQDIVILLSDDDNYPAMLKASNNPPPVLYVKGNLAALNYGKSLAIVGSRAASINGRKTAARIAKELTEQDVCIISGMARGIDTSAHKGAMYACNETGSTIAVLGTGLDVIYPAENKQLYEQITINGCVISEMPLGTQATVNQFPRRNRIVAAMSEAVLVVEAGIKSGSLITARFAQEQQKLLFAVPGTPGESRAQGSNHLIKEGAMLVEDANDILPFLKGNKTPVKKQKTIPKQKVLVFENNDANFSKQKNKASNLVDFLTVDGIYIDELIRLSGKDAASIAMEILELELSGIAERRPGNKIALTDQS